MRVGIVCPYSLTLPGGVQGQVLALGRLLRERGVDATVLGPCDGAPPDPAVIPLGVSLPTAANGSIAPVAPDLPAQLRTVAVLRDQDFDLLHLHEPVAPGPTMTTLRLKIAPMVGTFHAAGRSAAYRWFRPVTRWLGRQLSYRVAVSEQARDLATAALGGEYEVLFNGVELRPFLETEPWPTEGPTVFFLGRHEPRKGLAVLLEAMAELPREVRLWIGGDGPETDRMRSEHAGDPRLEWLGRISAEEKVARLLAADVFCAPSLGGESFGIILLEAMAAGTPVVASNLGGYARVARSGRDALLVPPGDAGPLAAALGEVLRDRTLASRLVESGRTRADSFSMARLAARYQEIYDDVLRGDPPRPAPGRGNREPARQP